MYQLFNNRSCYINTYIRVQLIETYKQLNYTNAEIIQKWIPGRQTILKEICMAWYILEIPLYIEVDTDDFIPYTMIESQRSPYGQV